MSVFISPNSFNQVDASFGPSALERLQKALVGGESTTTYIDSEVDERDEEAPQIAEKVARRLQRAEQRAIRAEDIASEFATEIETLKLQLEKEVLLNTQHELENKSLVEQNKMIKQLRQEKQEMEDRIEQCKLEIKRLETLSKDTTEQREKERESLQADVARISAEREVDTQVLEKLKLQVQQAEKELEETKKKHEEKLQQYRTKNEEHRHNLQRAENDWDSISNERFSNRNMLQNGRQQVEQLRRLVETAEEATKEANDRLTVTLLELEQVKVQKVTLQQRIQGLEDELRINKRSLDMAIDQRNQLEGKIEAISSKLRHSKRKAQKEAGERHKIEAVVDHLRKACTSATETATAVTRKLNEKEEHVAELRSKVAELECANKALKKQKEQLKLEYDIKKSNLHSTTMDRQHIVEQLDRETEVARENFAAVADKTSQNDALKNELKLLKQRKDELNRKLGNATQSIEFYRHQYALEKMQSKKQQEKVARLHARLQQLQQFDGETMLKNKLSLRAKQAESEYVWERLEEALKGEK